jgi:phosphoglycerol transferase
MSTVAIRRSAPWRTARRDEVIGFALATVGSLLAAVWALQLWDATWHVPFVYNGDGLFSELQVKTLIDGTWNYTNHALGAPFGLQFYDFPISGDNLNWLVMKILSLGSSSPALIENEFFILGFPAVGATAYVVLRWLRLSIPASVVCAILFALAPYHLWHGEAHLLLSSYAVVPVSAYLILSVLGGQALFARREPRPTRRLLVWTSKRSALMILLCVAIGSLGTYYALFTVLLLLVSGIAAAVARRHWRPLIQVGVLVAAIMLTLAANTAPDLIYRAEHGNNPSVGSRLPLESELYALKLDQMILPVSGDRIGPLRRLRQRYDTTAPLVVEGPPQALGVVTACGFVWLLLLAVGTVLGIGRRTEILERHRQLAFATVTAFLIGTMGGVSALIAYLISPQIRGWDRISIFIAFFSIAAVGLGLDAIRRRYAARRAMLWLGLLAVVLVFGIYDQSSRNAVPGYAADVAAASSDHAFVSQIEGEMPAQAEIFQLPYMSFPENGPLLRMLDYDPARGYVNSSDLRWSYGAVRGRPANWDAATLPMPALVRGLSAAGFDGIWVDRFGYADNGTAIESQLRTLLKVAPLGSSDGRFLFFDLRPFAARYRSRVGAAQVARTRHQLLYPATGTH